MNQTFFQTHTLRQIVGELLDSCYQVLKAYIEQAIQHDEVSDENIKQINKDLIGALNFYIHNYDLIQELTQSNSKFLRNLLFEVKHYRNNWAHSKDFTIREVHRIADTIQLMFEEFSLNINNQLYGFSPILGSVEIIKDKLYWISDRQAPRNQPNAFYFCIDQDLVYEPFFADFGPLNLGHTYRFVTELEKLLSDKQYQQYAIYHYTSLDSAKRANAAYLMGAFQVIILKMTADDAWKPFTTVKPAFQDFRDASYGQCTYKCTILHCLRGLEYAIKLKWFDVRKFNLRDYEFYERVENGDLNWIIPGKFIAFSGPSATQKDAEGNRQYTPEEYVPIFKQFGVTCVVRLNKKAYEEQRFIKNGIKHEEIYFLDGSVPGDDKILKFLEIAEKESVVAVHCKAGLGRTGTLIASYAIKHYRFPAPDFIGWIRICRPGSILGPQQIFLLQKQNWLITLGKDSTIWAQVKNVANEVNIEKRLSDLQLGPMSETDKKKAEKGDQDQAQILNKAKIQNQNSPGLSKK